MTTVNEAAIPEELKSFRQWVVWRYEQIDAPPKKPTKVPYSPITKRPASSVDKFSWAGFHDAMDLYKTGEYSGIGFVLTREDPYTVIDLDRPATAEDAKTNNDIFFTMNSYTEMSPSGTGVHIWTKADVGKGRNRRPVEVYNNMRFMTVTGHVHHNVPIEYRQDEVHELWLSIAPKTSEVYVTYDGNDPELHSDQDILNKAAAARNGYKFTQLWAGHFTEWYASQSEADFALIDILAFYTQNTVQIARLFRYSALGQRPKAYRDDYLLPTIQKAYDKLPPKVNFEALAQQTSEWVKEHLAAQQPAQTGDTTMPIIVPEKQVTELNANVDQLAYTATDVDSPYTFPEGLVGEIADYIYRSSPRPVKELALGAAIGLMAGITGNSFNISGLGLNVYLLMLAPTGTGKEAVHSGISKLMATIKPLVPSSELFLGASDIASPQALLKNLAKKQRCFVSVMGECGMWIRNLSDDKAPAHMSGLRRLLLALYGRSGQGNMVQPSIYADDSKNTEAIVSPSVSLLGESTQSRFFDAIDEDLIAEGFIPRWIIMEYNGGRPPHNEAHNTVYPNNELISGLASLCNFCMQQMASLQATNVMASPEAQEMMKQFDTFCDAQINNTAEEAIRDMWTRAHVKALKLAAICAVGKNIAMPCIQAKDFAWARHIVLKDVTKMCRRFNAGQLSAQVSANENVQHTKIVEAIAQYIRDPSVDAKYGIKPAMRAANAIPLYYLQRKLGNTKAFKNDRRGATTALQNALRSMALSGLITEVPDSQSFVSFNFKGKVYVVADLELLMQK